ncbi:hypothetical protein BP5796_02949 [Coleophoma crateriformis]|uniref:Sterol regulatory element-binding protein cleavage-activating protein n=1 Tax=Coleophoma crateriformis TaxID=565419 RepID=A0A3D8SLP9_9HELO|nr:hypothetical protein BP5796_02949 [Coleophoma crateriformis]
MSSFSESAAPPSNIPQSYSHPDHTEVYLSIYLQVVHLAPSKYICAMMAGEGRERGRKGEGMLMPGGQSLSSRLGAEVDGIGDEKALVTRVAAAEFCDNISIALAAGVCTRLQSHVAAPSVSLHLVPSPHFADRFDLQLGHYLQRNLRSSSLQPHHDPGDNPDSLDSLTTTPLVVRRTTEPPVLSSTHPLRNYFTRYGTRASRHPVITLLISVATASILIYPLSFLYTNNFTNGASNLPHHVWTSAQPFEGDSTVPDVAMRSVWVHGSYMKALEPNVLLSALEIQDALLGPTVNFDPRKAPGPAGPQDDGLWTTSGRDLMHASHGITNTSWFFHSPLQYWAGAAANIARDPDIITTVNEGSQRSTAVNVTLRHSIVFSGKRFEDHRLVAADALVITLIHKLDSPVGKLWEERASELAGRASKNWHLYPEDGRPQSSTLYEFRFQPLSFQDDLFLALAYSLCTAYFFLSLTKLRALKSRIGLILAVATQIAVSIMSSFTICAIFKIDISKIPREAYPLVVLSVGLENIFRLINAVIMTPPDRPTAMRMADAIGSMGHIALANATQNLVILWMLSRMVSPGLVAFCSFAAIALIFDFFYLLTFFAAVLSIDVRRTELTDALNRVSTRNQRYASSEKIPRQSWVDALIRGDTTFSTRISSTVVIIGFILIAQWHFSDNESFLQAASRLNRIWQRPTQASRSAASLLSVDINQARTPTAWLRLQDHETAHEVINVIKPHSHSYIARVYEPLIFVLDGSDRTPTSFGVRPFLPAAYDFIHRQWLPFLVAVIVSVSAVCLLMNYLLWDETAGSEMDDRPEDDPLLSVKTLGKGHALDIVLLTASNEGVLATVGLDRWIRIWDVRDERRSYLVDDPSVGIDPFPILAMTIDSDSNWLALLSAKEKVILWNIPEQRWGPVMSINNINRPPAAFFFGHDPAELINPVVVVRQNGMMTELHMEHNESRELLICKSPLVVVQPHAEKAFYNIPQPPLRIITASKRGCVHIVTQLESGWVSEGLEITAPDDDKNVISVVALPELSSFLAVRQHTVDLMDSSTHQVTHTFITQSMKPNSLRCFHSARRRPQCGSVGLASLGLVYTCATTGNVIMQVYLPERDGDTICFRDPWTPGSKTCCLWRETVERTYTIEDPGKWMVLQGGLVVGIRKREVSRPSSTPSKDPPTLRRRGQRASIAKNNDPDEIWEFWTMSDRGEASSIPLCNYDDNIQDHLLVSTLGPIAQIGRRSIGVSLGNVIKVVTVGNERFDGTDKGNEALQVAARRKKKNRKE